MIQDKRLHGDGSLDFSQHWFSPTGRLGETNLVNGTYDPHLEIRHGRVRFRLLNASGARVYNIGFADGRAFALIGTDAGVLDRPTAPPGSGSRPASGRRSSPPSSRASWSSCAALSPTSAPTSSRTASPAGTTASTSSKSARPKR